MDSITIDNLDKDLKERLQTRASRNGRSIEDEVREILRSALIENYPQSDNLTERIRQRFAGLGEIDLSIPSREYPRQPPSFDRRSLSI